MTGEFDRQVLRRLAAEYVETPRYDQPGNAQVRVPELVRSMREAEAAAATSHERGDLSRDFALGMWTAFAALRYDFGIEDSRYVNTQTDSSDGGPP